MLGGGGGRRADEKDKKETLTVIDNRTGKKYELKIKNNTIDPTALAQMKSRPKGPGLRYVAFRVSTCQ